MNADDIVAITRGVTNTWTKQRKAEERSSRARLYRSDRLSKDHVYQTDIAWEVIPKAYRHVSSDGKYPAKARQIYYAARPEIIERTRRALDSQYFTQTLLPRYMRTHPETATWWVAYDARGSLIEPHSGEEVPLGTIEVGNYLRRIERFRPSGLSVEGLSLRFPTLGPKNRCSAILYIEKEGFNELFDAVKLADRYDIAIMSAKGQSVVASRRLVDELCGRYHIPVLVLHDFDKYGFSIAQTLTSVSSAAEAADRVRYRFRNKIHAIDLGLRLADVQAWNLESEAVEFHGTFGEDSLATQEEQDFLRKGERVELNALTSENLITWIEGKLNEHGIKKVVPDEATLTRAYRRTYAAALINKKLDRMRRRATKEARATDIPPTIAEMIREGLEADPAKPWDTVLAEIVQGKIAEDQNGKK